MATPAWAAGLESLSGRPMQDLAAWEDVAPTLRSVVRGRQQMIFEHLRAPGSAVTVEDGLAWAWGCEGGDCRRDGLFLGHDPATGVLYMLLVTDGALDRQVPPRGTAWPATFVRAVGTIRPDLAERVSKGR
ncbi:hypothetical protein LPC08_06425 [Roseomonas sp. OT10]|uniref:hypothetical protein n=1 Tax=Roseomonas cutis TaxID=2897332 RepID=UPI001E3CC48B|nr:hypothetical protein [Roseomonas sp. OT10]UFN50257.1 hypothetical protein LPC08_06425 [Roseomonas sp. OT10]